MPPRAFRGFSFYWVFTCYTLMWYLIGEGDRMKEWAGLANENVYCMECRRFGCGVVVPYRTGWAFVNRDTNEIDSKGDKVNVGYHINAADAVTGTPEVVNAQT